MAYEDNFYMKLAEGAKHGYSIVHKFGRNESVGTSFVPIAGGGIYRTPQTGSATTLRVKAGNANDASDGTGARAVTIEGIDSTGALASEVLATNGTSAGAAGTDIGFMGKIASGTVNISVDFEIILVAT